MLVLSESLKKIGGNRISAGSSDGFEQPRIDRSSGEFSLSSLVAFESNSVLDKPKILCASERKQRIIDDRVALIALQNCG